MKLLVTLFWALVIGQVVGYIMTALSGTTDNVAGTAIVSLLFGCFVYALSALTIAKPTKKAD
ncbi:MAG: YjzD family protein [Streptococcaceae bacterium]|jgi:hypothetical protein|nr:YjzD family protein [Streptococcaceae bacterium]